MTKKIWIDTDIGTDVDDLLALIYALKNPELEVVGISTAHGDAMKRAKIASRVADLLGKKITVAAGADGPVGGDASYRGLGFEGEGIDYQSAKVASFPSAGYLEQALCDSKITIACIAPMTNIALALGAAPVGANFYIMGGNANSHNFRMDEKAASEVLKYKTQITLIPTEVAKKTYLTMEEVAGLKTGNAELDRAIAVNAKNWLKFSAYKDQGIFYLYDPLTIAAIARPDLVRVQESNGIKAAVDVDSQAFKEHFLEVLIK